MNKKLFIKTWPITLFSITGFLIYYMELQMHIFSTGLWSNNFSIFWDFVIVVAFITLFLQLKTKSFSYITLILLALLVTSPIYNIEVYLLMILNDLNINHIGNKIFAVIVFIPIMSLVAYGTHKNINHIIMFLVVAAIVVSPISYSQAKKYKLQSTNKSLVQDSQQKTLLTSQLGR